MPRFQCHAVHPPPPTSLSFLLPAVDARSPTHGWRGKIMRIRGRCGGTGCCAARHSDRPEWVLSFLGEDDCRFFDGVPRCRRLQEKSPPDSDVAHFMKAASTTFPVSRYRPTPSPHLQSSQPKRSYMHIIECCHRQSAAPTAAAPALCCAPPSELLHHCCPPSCNRHVFGQEQSPGPIGCTTL